jgi:hypothetical protein
MSIFTNWEVFFLLPTNRTHKQYQDFVTSQIQFHHASGMLHLTSSDWLLAEKLWGADLSGTAPFLEKQYGRRGPKPIDPDCMLRSFLLMLLTRQGYSITYWVDEMRRAPIFAILSGFEPSNTPGIGTFYDFFTRLWDSGSLNPKKHENRRKRKPQKGKKKGDKALTTSPGKVARLVKRLLKYTSSNSTTQAFDRLFEFFRGTYY